jgi:hypothetical protein
LDKGKHIAHTEKAPPMLKERWKALRMERWPRLY